MSKTKRHLLLLTLVLTLLAIPTFVVFAKELGKLTVTGPGIQGELTLNDPNFTLEKSGFFEQAVLSKPPTGLDMEAGYSITAHLNMDGELVPFAQMIYYATNEGQPGYLHYTARINGDALQTVDEWDILSRSADTALRDLLTSNKVVIQSALVAAAVKAEPPAAAEPAASVVEPATVPVTSQAPVPFSFIVVGILAAILLAGAGLMIRRRTVSATG